MAGALLILPSVGGGAAVHELHIVYADFAVEGPLVAGRVRFFQDDLERALGPLVGASALALAPGPEADALVLRYLGLHLALKADGVPLVAELLASGRDELDREPVWWVLVQFRSPAPVEALALSNTLLFEVFDDQRNIMKLVHFPDGYTRTFYFAPGESEQRVRFR